MKKTAGVLMIVFVGAMLAGCSQHVGNLSALAAGTYKSENINPASMVGKDITGKACASIFFIFPTGYPKLDEAVSQATAKNNGDFMMNARIYYDSWWIPFIYGQNCWRVEGDVYKTIK